MIGFCKEHSEYLENACPFCTYGADKRDVPLNNALKRIADLERQLKDEIELHQEDHNEVIQLEKQLAEQDGAIKGLKECFDSAESELAQLRQESESKQRVASKHEMILKAMCVEYVETLRKVSAECDTLRAKVEELDILIDRMFEQMTMPHFFIKEFRELERDLKAYRDERDAKRALEGK